MSTSVPSKRNSFGSRTAWLSPFLNSFAVFIGAVKNIYVLYIYISQPEVNSRA